MARPSAPRRRRRRRTAKASSRAARIHTVRNGRARGKQSPPAARPAAKPAPKRRRRTVGETSRDFVLIPVSRIDRSPWGARLVYADIRELADSIRGDVETEGVGVLAPLLVRPTARGRYELLDGSRRWRAAKQIAEERGDPDYLVPARIFHASDRIARLITAAAEGEQDRRRPIELALLYRELRDALEKEVGHPVGVRAIAGIGWHGRSMIADYLAIGRAITRDMLRRAGILDANGQADEAVIAKLRVPDLLGVAAVPTIAGRVAALRAKADQIRGTKRTAVPSDAPDAPEVPVSTAERLAQIRDGGLRIHVRAPIRTLAPAAASELVARDLAPAIVAAVDQAHGGVGGSGYYAEFRGERIVLVVPRDVEALTAAQIRALAEEIETFRTRVRRAMRMRVSTRPSARIDS